MCNPARFISESILIVAGMLVIAGCETPGERLDSKVVNAVRPGITTRQDILKTFGEPRSELSGNGRTLLYYERVYPGSKIGYGPTEPGEIDCFSVLLDSNNRVVRTHFSSHAVDVFAASGSVSAGTSVSEKTFREIQSGTTTRAQAIQILGEPDRETLDLGGEVVLCWDYWQSVLGRPIARTVRLYLNRDNVVVAVKSARTP